MDLQLRGKVAIVTGASKGIGRAIAQLLVDEGMRVTVAARPRDELVSLAAPSSDACLVQAVDLRLPDTPSAVVNATVARFGRLDVLVNNAGATKRGDFLALPDADWADGFALKFFGAMRCSRAAWPHLQTYRGCIVNIVGIGGRKGSAEVAVGGAVHAGAPHLTHGLGGRGCEGGGRGDAVK